MVDREQETMEEGANLPLTDTSSVRRAFLGVFFTSSAVLLLQISLTRIFSYTIWYTSRT